MRVDKESPCVYEAEDGEPVCLVDSPFSPPSLKGVLVDHCMYMGIYIGLRAQHPGVWLRPP